METLTIKDQGSEIEMQAEGNLMCFTITNEAEPDGFTGGFASTALGKAEVINMITFLQDWVQNTKA